MTPPPPVAAVQDRSAEIAALATTVLGFDTSNPPGETVEIVDWLDEWLTAIGLEPERVVTDPAKPNLVVTIPGERPETLLYLGHLDTVPYDPSEWEYDPLGERVEERIYGRGATDMKGPMAAMLESIRAVAETETVPPLTLALALVSDEEVVGDAGLPAVMEADVLDADACLIGETTCQGNNHSVTVADRGSIWLTLAASGTAAHGSRPMLGENAIDRLYRGVERIRHQFGGRALEIPPAVEPIVEESVKYYAPVMDEETVRRLFEFPTINLGTIEGGDAINSVPTAARAELDIRLTPGIDTQTLLGELRGCVDSWPGVQIEDLSWSVGSYEKPDGSLVDAVASTAAEVTGDRIYRRSATGGGDAKKLRHAEISTVEFALGTDTVHANDEYTTVTALARNAEIYTRVPYVYAANVASE